MKLLTKYNRVNILATILVLLFSSLCYYFVLHYILINQLDEDLKVEEQEIRDYAKQNNTLPNAANYKDEKITFEPTTTTIKREINSITVYDSSENENIPSRQFIFLLSNAGGNYKVSIIKSQQETENLISLIVKLTLAIIVLLLAALFIINRFVLNKLWLPFNKTLTELKQFNLDNKNPIKLTDSDINEFKELNKAVTEMSKRVIVDYEVLKSFTENASHEIQTPLAVITTKLELLMQSENFSEAEMRYIETIEAETNRLSKLNQSLLLLTKIDNQQFNTTESIDIAAITNRLLKNYEELITAKNIILTKKIEERSVVLMNETMSTILLSNLITNAIKHNIDKGSIHILLNKDELLIQNTGMPLNGNTDSLFERFKKGKVNSESLGLGLSIVKKIIEQSGFSIQYTYANELHTLRIFFATNYTNEHK